MLFLNYFEKIFKHYPNPKLYLRGGAVFAIKVYQDTNSLIQIKDFDFVLEDERCCNDYFYHEFSKEFGIYLNGFNKKSQGKNTKLHIMRHRNSMNYELSVCHKDCTELPMTSMKIFITEQNYTTLLTSLDNIEYKFNNNMLKNFNIIIPEHNKDGMFNEEFHSDDKIISNIILNTTNNKLYQQFLYYMIKNPTNICRLKYKNVPKSIMVKNLYKSTPSWLLNEELMLNLVDQLISTLTSYINNIYDSYKEQIKILNKKIVDYNDQIIIYECINDLIGIGGDPLEALDFLNGGNNNEHIKEAPYIKKFKNKNALINRINNLISNCKKYDINFNQDMLNLNISDINKQMIIDRDLIRTNLSTIFVEMFEKIDLIFDNININRWVNTFEESDPLISIFQFDELPLKLNNTNIIINEKDLSKSVTWLAIKKIQKL